MLNSALALPVNSWRGLFISVHRRALHVERRKISHNGITDNKARMSSTGISPEALQDGTVYCVGRNYVAHLNELPNLLGIPSELPTTPMIFLKPPAAIQCSTGNIQLPAWSTDVQHEVELAVQLGEDLQPCSAAVAIDLTARDVQAQLKQLGHPWTLSKGFRGSCPMGSRFSLDGIDMQQLNLALEVNGCTRQSSTTSLMIFKVAEIVAYLKQYFPLQAGDWILTGTPEGVAALKEGDTVTASVSHEGQLLSEGTWQVHVAAAAPADAWKQAGP